MNPHLRSKATIPELILASASPRRAEILRVLGLDFRVAAAHVDEIAVPGELAQDHVIRLARLKAVVAARHRSDALVIAGDTVVVMDGQVLGKPASPEEAVAMLLLLQGRSHEVLTGLAIATPTGSVESGFQATEVVFRSFGEGFARGYVETGECMDKAGAYGIQGAGAALVQEFHGDYFNVVGLPVPLLLDLLRKAGWVFGFSGLEAEVEQQ